MCVHVRSRELLRGGLRGVEGGAGVEGNNLTQSNVKGQKAGSPQGAGVFIQKSLEGVRHSSERLREAGAMLGSEAGYIDSSLVLQSLFLIPMSVQNEKPF